jgi:hypothetical protein
MFNTEQFGRLTDCLVVALGSRSAEQLPCWRFGGTASTDQEANGAGQTKGRLVVACPRPGLGLRYVTGWCRDEIAAVSAVFVGPVVQQFAAGESLTFPVPGEGREVGRAANCWVVHCQAAQASSL